MLILGDSGFHAREGNPPNLKVCPRGAWNDRMLIETVYSMLTLISHTKNNDASSDRLPGCPVSSNSQHLDL